jgi:hypothetical protein
MVTSSCFAGLKVTIYRMNPIPKKSERETYKEKYCRFLRRNFFR